MKATRTTDKKRIFSRAVCLLICIFVLTPPLNGCRDHARAVTSESTASGVQSEQTSAAASGEEGVTFTLQSGENLSFLTPVQAAYMADEDYDSISKYAVAGQAQDEPKAIRLTWNDNVPTDASFSRYTVEISETDDFETVRSVTCRTTQADVYNLKTGTVYFWRVVAVVENQTFTSPVARFSTAGDQPRILKIGGVTNARDLGGWRTENGGSVRQGLFYRSGKLNADGKETPVATAEGLRTLSQTLGIKTEIDLRRKSDNENGGITESLLGTSVNYYCISLNEDADAIQQIFRILADETNYPVLVHCSVGVDRTGAICALVSGLVGVAEDDLYRDYLLSNFSSQTGFLRKASDLGELSAVKRMTGTSLSQKTYRYLLSFGIPAAELDSIISILRNDEKEEFTTAKR